MKSHSNRLKANIAAWVFVFSTPSIFAQNQKADKVTRVPTYEELFERFNQINSELSVVFNDKDRIPEWDAFVEEGNRLHREAYNAFSKVSQFEYGEYKGTITPLVAERIDKIKKLREERARLRDPFYAVIKRDGIERAKERQQEMEKNAVPPTPQLHALKLDPAHFPRIDGSTSTQPLAMLVGCRNFDVGHSWVDNVDVMNPRRKPSPFRDYDVHDIELRLAEFSLAAATDKADDRFASMLNGVLIKNASTHSAYTNIVEGKSELALIARRPNQTELDFALSQKNALDVEPCALDAFVFLVNDKNPVQNLTKEQIRSLYSGDLNRWNEVGGTQDIVVKRYRRPENSGSEVLMKEIVMKGIPMMQTQEFVENGIMSFVYNRVSTEPNGLAYSVGYYERFMAGSAHTRVIAIDGVKPTPENIRNRSYPFIAEVVAVIQADLPKDSPGRQLRDWLLSPEGQSVVEQSGYSPIGPTVP